MDSPPPYSDTHTPPNYSVKSSNRPPTYSFPKTFAVGSNRSIPPLVTTEQLKNHLGLLHVFAKLRAQIDALQISDYSGIPYLPEDKEKRWCWFVAQAVERFSIWCDILTHTDSTRPAVDILPPADVLMVWHAYMLNPRWYAEDCSRLRELQRLKDFMTVLSHSLSSGLSEILSSEPTNARMNTWVERTGRAFDPLQDAEVNQSRTVLCPKCRLPNNIPYMNAHGTGFFQSNFKVQCANVSCANLTITRSTLCARRLVEDLARSVSDPGGENAACLPGTLRNLQTAEDVANGQSIKQLIFRAPVFSNKPHAPIYEIKDVVQKEKWVLAVLDKTGFDLKRLGRCVGLKMKAQGGNLLKRIMSAYQGSYGFSVELVGAVIRQGAFVKKMDNLQWTHPHFFDDNEVALQHAIARYHAFLDLMSVESKSFYVPTLDIDLAWHTHQLLGETYQNNCHLYVGRYVDHDDKVEESVLSTSFDLTCRAWVDRYGVPYTHCGCPPPGLKRKGHIARLKTTNKSSLTPPSSDDILAATHASEHNSVLVLANRRGMLSSGISQQTRREKMNKRQERVLISSSHKTSEERKDSEEHEPAFLERIDQDLLANVIGDIWDTASYGGNVVLGDNTDGMGGCAVGGGACTVGGGCSGGGCSGGACGGSSCGGGGGSCGGGGCGG